MTEPALTPEILAHLKSLERQVLWHACWMIHNANHLREKGEVKVGGHQASSASLASILTALYFHVLRPEDRVAVKPHASPVFHGIQYVMGNQTREKLENFRGFGGAQSYPSRTKDIDDVDFPQAPSASASPSPPSPRSFRTTLPPKTGRSASKAG